MRVFRHWGEIWDTNPTYLVLMELCKCDLETYLCRQSNTQGLGDYREICEVAASILAGLQFIHSLGEVHRDLKPENGNTQ